MISWLFGKEISCLCFILFTFVWKEIFCLYFILCTFCLLLMGRDFFCIWVRDFSYFKLLTFGGKRFFVYLRKKFLIQIIGKRFFVYTLVGKEFLFILQTVYFLYKKFLKTSHLYWIIIKLSDFVYFWWKKISHTSNCLLLVGKDFFCLFEEEISHSNYYSSLLNSHQTWWWSSQIVGKHFNNLPFIPKQKAEALIFVV